MNHLQQSVKAAAQYLRNPSGITENDEYQLYNECHASVMCYRTLSSALSSERLSILDVGSGELCTAHLLVENNKNIKKYTAIDWIKDATNYIHKFSDGIEAFEYIAKDYCELTESDLQRSQYDIVIIDVEPHGREGQVYEKIRPFMKGVHLCILKHVACLDWWGSGLANWFLKHYIEQKLVRDYFAASNFKKGWRDIFIIMTTDPVELQIECQKLALGEPLGRQPGGENYVYEAP